MENKDTVNVGRPADETKKVKKTNAPKKAKVPKGEKYEPRVAKLSGRTHKGLIRLIKEDRIAHAFDKYNETYMKMQAALKRANKVKSQAEVDFEYNVVAAYAAKMAKYGAKVTKHDLRLSKALGRDSKKPRKIKVPNFLLRNLTKVMRFFNRVTGSAREFISDKTYAASDAIFRKTQKQLKNDFEKQLQSAIASARKTGEIGDEVKRFNLNELDLEEGREELKNIVLNKPSTASQADELKDKDTKTGGNNVPPVKPTSSITNEGLNSLFTTGKGKADENKTTTSDVVEPKKEEPKTEGTEVAGDKKTEPVGNTSTNPTPTEKKPATTMPPEARALMDLRRKANLYYGKSLNGNLSEEERKECFELYKVYNDAIEKRVSGMVENGISLGEKKQNEQVTPKKKDEAVTPSVEPKATPVTPSVADMKDVDAQFASATEKYEQLRKQLIAAKQEKIAALNAANNAMEAQIAAMQPQKTK